MRTPANANQIPFGLGDRFRGSHLALDDPGLAPDLGHDPARPEGEDRAGAGDRDGAQEPRGPRHLPPPPPAVDEPNREQQQRRPDPDHRVEGEVQQGVGGRAFVGRDVVEAGDDRVAAEPDQEGVEVGDPDRPLHPVVRCRCRRCTRSASARFPGCTRNRRTSPAGGRPPPAPRCRRRRSGSGSRCRRRSAGSGPRGGGAGRGGREASRPRRSRRRGTRRPCRRRGSCAGPRSPRRH